LNGWNPSISALRLFISQTNYQIKNVEGPIMRTNKLDVMKYRSFTGVFLLVIILFAGCSEKETTLIDSSNENPAGTLSKPVIHHASLGGADVCEALGLPTGCDANFSLVANMKADGTVSGQWQDTFAGGGGLHATVDCMNIMGKFAVIGGEVTHGSGSYVAGVRVITAVMDNGTSANDPPDQLSFSFIPSAFGLPEDCNDPLYTYDFFASNGLLVDLTHGQVKVW
jgi:hypothetical protein